MKVIEVGTGSNASYESLVLKKGAKQNNFGTYFYLKEAIYLVQRKGVTDYTIGQSRFSQNPQLNLSLTDDLKKEFDLIAEAISMKMPDLKLKTIDGDKLFIKLGKDCGKIPNNCTLQFSLRIYAVFQQSSEAAFLQYEVSEHQAEKISLLSQPAINYVPNSINLNESF